MARGQDIAGSRPGVTVDLFLARGQSGWMLLGQGPRWNLVFVDRDQAGSMVPGQKPTTPMEQYLLNSGNTYPRVKKISWSFYLGHWFPARSHESGLDLGDEPAVHLGSWPGTTSNLPWSLARNQQSMFVLGHEPTIHLGSWPRTSNPRWPLTTHQQFTLVRGQKPAIHFGPWPRTSDPFCSRARSRQSNPFHTLPFLCRGRHE